MSAHIFVSYARVDSAFVDKLQASLLERGFDVWVDTRRLEGGDIFAQAIEHEINRCDVMLVILSPDAVQSTWVRKEISYAQAAKKRMVPLMWRRVDRVPIEVADVEYISFEQAYDDGLDRLIATMSRQAADRSGQPANTTPAAEPATDSGTDPAAGVSSAPSGEQGVETPGEQLVKIAAAPAAPPSDLNSLFNLWTDAKSRGDLEAALVYGQQLVERDPNFANGLVATELAQITAELVPQRQQRLRAAAHDAMERQEWRKAAGAWQGLLETLPTDVEASKEVRSALTSQGRQAMGEGVWSEAIDAWAALVKLEPQSDEARISTEVAEQNQQWAWMYDNAVAFARAGNVGAAEEALRSLWTNAPSYGDPQDITAQLTTKPATTAGQEVARRVQEIHAKAAAEQQELRAKAAAEQKAEHRRERRTLLTYGLGWGAFIGSIVVPSLTAGAIVLLDSKSILYWSIFTNAVFGGVLYTAFAGIAGWFAIFPLAGLVFAGLNSMFKMDLDVWFPRIGWGSYVLSCALVFPYFSAYLAVLGSHGFTISDDAARYSAFQKTSEYASFVADAVQGAYVSLGVGTFALCVLGGLIGLLMAHLRARRASRT